MRKVVPKPFPDPMIRDAIAFGQAVRATRTGASISLEAAAEALGISKATLGDLEVGKGTVALGTAIRVARELGAALFMAPHAVHVEAAVALQTLRNEGPGPRGGPSAEGPVSKAKPRDGKSAS